MVFSTAHQPRIYAEPDACSHKATYVYIAANGHSSSTLVSLLLNSHPRILAIGEMHAPAHPVNFPEMRECSCGVPSVTCRFFTQLGQRLEDQGFDFPLTEWNLRYKLDGSAALSRLMFYSLRYNALEALRDATVSLIPAYRRRRDYLDRMHVAFVREALDIYGADVFVDAYKDPIRLRYLAKLPGMALKVIYLVRNPLGWTNSMLKLRNPPSSARLARAWVVRQKNIERQLRRLPAESFLMRYEDLCLDPDGMLAAAGEFIGVGPIAQPEDFYDGEHHVIGNRMRHIKNRPGRIRYDDGWRKMSASQQADIVRVAGPTARRLGYDI